MTEHDKGLTKTLQGRAVLVLANLKARNMRGVKSNGMLLAASNAEHTVVQLLSPPEGAAPGERVWFGEETDQATQPPAETPNKVSGLPQFRPAEGMEWPVD